MIVFDPLLAGHVIQRMRSGRVRIFNGNQWTTLSLITQERIGVGASNFLGIIDVGVDASQLAKFIGPMAGFHRHFHRPAVGNRCRADIGFAHRRDSSPLAANGRLEAAGRQKVAYTFLII